MRHERQRKPLGASEVRAASHTRECQMAPDFLEARREQDGAFRVPRRISADLEPYAQERFLSEMREK